MSEFVEIRWHARAGQGAVTAAKALADAATAGGKYVQAFPEYGPERMGAPLKAYNRVSENPILIHCQVTSPSIVIIIDQTLIATVNVTEGVADEGIYIINTEKSPEELKKKLGVAKATVYAVDATKISIETIGRSIPNMPILGVVARATDIITVDSVKYQVEKSFGKKFGRSVVEANIKAVDRAYAEVKMA